MPSVMSGSMPSARLIRNQNSKRNESSVYSRGQPRTQRRVRQGAAMSATCRKPEHLILLDHWVRNTCTRGAPNTRLFATLFGSTVVIDVPHNFGADSSNL